MTLHTFSDVSESKLRELLEDLRFDVDADEVRVIPINKDKYQVDVIVKNDLP